MAPVTKTETDKPRKEVSVWRLSREYLPHWKMALICGVITVFLSLGDLLPAYITGEYLSTLVDWQVNKPRIPVNYHLLLLALFFNLIAINLLRYVATMARTDLDISIMNGLRERLYNAIQRHSMGYHKKTTTGDLIARSTNDIGYINGFTSQALFFAIDLLFFCTGAIIILISKDWVFALISIVSVIPSFLLIGCLGKKLKKMWREQSDSYAEVTTALQENIAGARVVRAFAQEEAEKSKFKKLQDDYKEKDLRIMPYWIYRGLTSNTIFGMVQPICLIYGTYQVIHGNLEVGAILMCLNYSGNIYHRLLRIIDMTEVYQNASAGAERIYEILDEQPSIQTNRGADKMPVDRKGVEITFDNVTFGFDAETPVLKNVSFKAEPGKTIAIVGHTGCGKSTLVGLIPRFYDPQSGSVAINGIKVSDIKLHDLRRNIGIVFQETFLFSATVSENIRYGRPEATQEEIIAAAKLAQAHDFIMQLEKGYDTILGERGASLSGGQGQRIAIARAVLLNPQILVLDDATASVDSETEREIRETMKSVAVGRTTFIIAHRISTVAHADMIIVLKDGRIHEYGTHKSLYEKNGIYRQMCDTQITASHGTPDTQAQASA